MRRRESLLEKAERHVREGEAIIARQRELIDKLARDGHPIDVAQEFLRKFMRVQAEHVAHWERLLEETWTRSSSPPRAYE